MDQEAIKNLWRIGQIDAVADFGYSINFWESLRAREQDMNKSCRIGHETGKQEVSLCHILN